MKQKKKSLFFFCCGMKWLIEVKLRELPPSLKLIPLILNCGVMGYRFPSQLSSHQSISFIPPFSLLFFNLIQTKIIDLLNKEEVKWNQRRVSCGWLGWKPITNNAGLSINKVDWREAAINSNKLTPFDFTKQK